jgi:nitrite reductase/ring-hydroxylating ferredoxin subunit
MAVAVARLEDVPENGSRCFEVEGRKVLLCRSSAGVFAVENMCSHAYSLLEGGRIRGAHIFCPLHGVRFDMRTGAPSGELTKKPIKTWTATVEDGSILVDFS